MDKNLIDVKENYIYRLDIELLDILLKDRSSGKNTIWATDNYASRGYGYQSYDYIFYLDKATRKTAFMRKSDIAKNNQDIEKYKVFIPAAYGAGEDFPHQIVGQPEYVGKDSVCSQTYLYAAFDSENEARNFITYLKTKTFRALVLACRIEQHLPNKTYRFVPLQDFSKPWTDAELYKKYGLTPDEKAFIESTIKPME